MGLLERIAAERRAGGGGVAEAPQLPGLPARQGSIDWYIENYLLPAHGVFGYGGVGYTYGLAQTYATGSGPAREIAGTLPAYSRALKGCPPAFAAQLVRAMVISQARFVWRNLPSSPDTPRRLFGTKALSVLERPWPNATTGQLLARMEWHAGLAGNAYIARQPGRVRVLRPDWVAIVYGSQREPDDPAGALDAEVIGYVYQNGGWSSRSKPETLLPDAVAHWSPLPDPESPELGMSWITPALRDIQGDRAATEHKLMFFSNGATPNMVIKGLPSNTKQAFDNAVDMIEQKHAGLANAYRTLYLSQGADATVVGADMKQLDFAMTQGRGETRIAMLSRVPAPILQIAEGLQGSSLNAGNFTAARRTFADTWVYPTLEDAAHCLEHLCDPVPSGAELWFDPADMPILREDGRDAAEIEQIKATTIVTYVKDGFTPESAVRAVQAQNIALLEHSGMLSVQLQPPGSMFPQPGQPPPPPPPPSGQQQPGQGQPQPAPAGQGQPPKPNGQGQGKAPPKAASADDDWLWDGLRWRRAG